MIQVISIVKSWGARALTQVLSLSQAGYLLTSVSIFEANSVSQVSDIMDMQLHPQVACLWLFFKTGKSLVNWNSFSIILTVNITCIFAVHWSKVDLGSYPLSVALTSHFGHVLEVLPPLLYNCCVSNFPIGFSEEIPFLTVHSSPCEQTRWEEKQSKQDISEDHRSIKEIWHEASFTFRKTGFLSEILASIHLLCQDW